MSRQPLSLPRRRFISQLAAASALTAWRRPTFAAASDGHIPRPKPPARRRIALDIASDPYVLDGRPASPILVNGTLPAPLLRFTEGDEVEIAVTNHLREDTSIHWHGILLPAAMDGVPGLSFPGIRPGETFVYRYPLRQSGTYWYHSHSGLQEQIGLYGPLVIDPADGASPGWDREHVIVLSDWTFERPETVLARLKKQSHYFNRVRPTMANLLASDDVGAAFRERLMWARMRMDQSDLADVSAVTYAYLLNGHTPAMAWRAACRPGERVLLRIINASAMTLFDFRVPGLPLTVVGSDGQPVVPVECDELRLGVAETYDVIVQPGQPGAWTLFAESLDRSGYACGTLASSAGATAVLPPRRPKAFRGMEDMSMAGHDGHGGHASHDMNAADGSQSAAAHQSGDHHGHAPPAPRYVHDDDDHGPGNAMVNRYPISRVDEPGVGLDDAPHRVLRYSQLRAPAPWPDRRPPARDIELHLTGNMERYMWSFDGIAFHAVEGPIEFGYGERLRLILVNDTMMEHPIHLHGMWLELENGQGELRPRKHTVTVKPNERLTALVSADARGWWAFHCHLLYHMEMGMFRAVRVA